MELISSNSFVHVVKRESGTISDALAVEDREEG